MKKPIKYFDLKAITFTLLLMCSNSIFGQINFTEGYIILLSGDTIRGEIDYREWDVNPNTISFKDTYSVETVYSATDIYGFNVNNEKYFGATVETEVSDYANKTNVSSNLQIENQSVFLKVLISGEISLLYLKNSTKNINYYIGHEGKIEFLRYKKYNISRDGHIYSTENKGYIGQLNYIFQQYPTIVKEKSNILYHQKDLTEIFEDYYDQSQEIISYQFPKEKIKLEWGCLAGVSSSKLVLHGSRTVLNNLYLNADYTTSYDFTYGIFLEYIPPRNLKKWVLKNELIFTTFEVSGNSEDYDRTAFIKFGLSHIKLNSLLKFSYPVNSFHFFANAGFSYSRLVNEKSNKRSISYKFGSDDRDWVTSAFDATRKYEVGGIIGCGIRYKRTSLEIRHESSIEISKTIYLATSIRRGYVLVSFRL